MKRKLVAVRLDPALHDEVIRLCLEESGAGRPLRVTDVYEAALRAYLAAAGRKTSG